MTNVAFLCLENIQINDATIASLLRVMNMSEQKRYMNLSMDAPHSNTLPEYKSRDELLNAMDAYIEECEAQNDLRGLAQLENSLDVKVSK